MNVFEAVKQSVTTRQAAEHYGIHVNRNGMACCPFHHDKMCIRDRYGLEQVYNVIDSRYRSGKPLIVTTNLTLTELQNPQDTPHARIYDRLLEMCAPVCFSGENFRRESAQNKLNRLKQLMND